PHHETPVANAVRDESLRCGIARFLTIGVVTDKQIRTQPDALPTDKHQQEVVGQHQRQHREHEEIQESEEPIEPLVLVHVADCEEVDQETNECHEQRINTAQPVHRQTEVSAKLSDLNPRPEMIEYWFSRSECAV